MKRKLSIALSLLLLTSIYCIGQQKQTSSTNVLDKGADQVRLFNARQDFLGGQLQTALQLYKSVFKDQPKNGNVAYRIGECYLEMKDIDDAIKYMEKAKKLNPKANPELDLTLGKAYQLNGKIDKAMSEFKLYRNTIKDSPKKLSDSRVDYYINQCKTAKELMAHPDDVKISNLGLNVNSSYDDKSPIIFNGGKTLLFTSRRPMESKHHHHTDKASPEQKLPNYDHVYNSDWDTVKNTWGLAYPMEGPINRDDGYIACTSISADGQVLFIYKNNTVDAVGGDLFASKMMHSGKWASAKPLGTPINSSYYEDAACMSPDGNTLYFVSERPGGYGRGDIYKSKKISRHEWGEPVNLGPVINTDDDENGLSLSPDGKMLFFSSEGHNSMGEYDIFKTTLRDSVWTKPVNLGYPINSVRVDANFQISKDGSYAYFSSDRQGGLGGRDIYKVDLSKYHILFDKSEASEPLGMSVLKGRVVALRGGAAIETTVNIYNASGKLMKSTRSKDGKYRVVLKGNQKYEVKVNAKGYQAFEKDINLPASKTGTYVKVQDLILK